MPDSRNADGGVLVLRLLRAQEALLKCVCEKFNASAIETMRSVCVKKKCEAMAMIVPTCCQVESGKADPFNAWCASYCASDLQVGTLKVKEYFASDAQNNRV